MAEIRDDFGDEQFNDDDPENEFSEETGLKENDIFMIDCQPSMWEPCTLADEKLAGKTWLEACVIAAADMAHQRALEGGIDDIGITFFNVSPSCVPGRGEHNKSGLAHIYAPFPLKPVSGTSVRNLRDFSVSSLEPGASDTTTRTTSLINAIWAASIELPGLQKLKGEAGVVSYGAQRVMIFTRDQDPTDGGGDLTSILQNVQNVISKGGALELVPLVGVSESFDLKPFWETMLERPGDQQTSQVFDASLTQEMLMDPDEDVRIVNFSSLSTFVRSRASRKRPLARLLWLLGPGGTEIGVKLYASVRPATRGTTRTFHNTGRGEELVRVTRYIDEGTGTALPEGSRPRRYHPKSPDRGSDAARLPRMLVSESEMRTIKYPLTKGMDLVGFRPMEALQPWHQVRASMFLRPDDVLVPGSTAPVAALLGACIKKNRFAVALLVRNKTSEPSMVALLPQAEERDEAPGAQISPAGFYVITLPYAEDVRHPERDPNLVGSAAPPPDNPAAMAAAGALIDALRLENFDSTALRNPSMQQFFAALEVKALRDGGPVPDPKEADETLLPPKDFPDDLAEAFVRAVCVGTDWDIEELRSGKIPEKPKAKKRAAPGAAPAAAARCGAATKELPSYTDDELAKMAPSKFKKLTNDHLRKLLEERNIEFPDKAKKDVLLERLKAHLPGSSGG